MLLCLVTRSRRIDGGNSQNWKTQDYLDKLILGNLVNLRLNEKNSHGKFSIEGTAGVVGLAADIAEASEGPGDRANPSFSRSRCPLAAVVGSVGEGSGGLGSGKPPMGRTKPPVDFLIESLTVSGTAVMFLARGLVVVTRGVLVCVVAKTGRGFDSSPLLSLPLLVLVGGVFLRQSHENPNLLSFSILSGVMLVGLFSCQNLNCRRWR